MYRCQFPGCKYETMNRNQIHYHHIKPKELKGSNKKSNMIWLCPNHHSMIYIPESSKGIHSINTTNSVILLNVYSSTGGRILEYEQNSKINFWEME